MQLSQGRGHSSVIGSHIPYLDLSRRLAQERRTQGRSKRLERHPPASVQGQLPLGQGLFRTSPEDLYGGGGPWHGGRTILTGGSSPETLKNLAQAHWRQLMRGTRTIYDDSWCRANAHIQQNMVAKTTAPTVTG